MSQLITTSDAFIFFGGVQHAFIPDQLRGTCALEHQPLNAIPNLSQLAQLIFLRQVHGAQGHVITSVTDAVPSFVREGDFLITNVPRVGLAVATADCLPIVIIDSKNKAVGIAHAGWRGSVARIAESMLTCMVTAFGTRAQEVQVFFGPSARPCCYEVQKDFLAHLAPFSYGMQAVQMRNNKLYFDITAFNGLQLQQAGVRAASIATVHNQCTICDPLFCSARRDKNKKRQVTVVSLT